MVALPLATEQSPALTLGWGIFFGAVWTDTRPRGSCPQGHGLPIVSCTTMAYGVTCVISHTSAPPPPTPLPPFPPLLLLTTTTPAGIGVVSLGGAPLSLPSFVTPQFKEFFRLGRVWRTTLPTGKGGVVHLFVVCGYQGSGRGCGSASSY